MIGVPFDTCNVINIFFKKLNLVTCFYHKIEIYKKETFDPQSSIHGLFGSGDLNCTAGLACRFIFANVTSLQCTLILQDVD